MVYTLPTVFLSLSVEVYISKEHERGKWCIKAIHGFGLYTDKGISLSTLL